MQWGYHVLLRRRTNYDKTWKTTHVCLSVELVLLLEYLEVHVFVAHSTTSDGCIDQTWLETYEKQEPSNSFNPPKKTHLTKYIKWTNVKILSVHSLASLDFFGRFRGPFEVKHIAEYHEKRLETEPGNNDATRRWMVWMESSPFQHLNGHQFLLDMGFGFWMTNCTALQKRRFQSKRRFVEKMIRYRQFDRSYHHNVLFIGGAGVQGLRWFTHWIKGDRISWRSQHVGRSPAHRLKSFYGSKRSMFSMFC